MAPGHVNCDQGLHNNTLSLTVDLTCHKGWRLPLNHQFPEVLASAPSKPKAGATRPPVKPLSALLGALVRDGGGPQAEDPSPAPDLGAGKGRGGPLKNPTFFEISAGSPSPPRYIEHPPVAPPTQTEGGKWRLLA